MKIKMVDCKNKEVVRVKIDIDKFTFIVVPEIVDNRFRYLGNRLMNIRKKYMQKYINNEFLSNEEMEYKLKNEIFNNLTNECEHLHRTEGLKYYTVIGG